MASDVVRGSWPEYPGFVSLMNMKKVFLLLVLVIALALPGARAALLGTYDFATESAVPTTAGMTFGAFSRANVTAAAVAGEFSSSAWTIASSLDTAEYVQFTLTPSSGTITFSSFSFFIDSHKANGGGNDGGPNDLAIRLFASSDLSTVLAAQTYTGVQDTRQTLTFDPADQTSAAGFTIRLYGWNAENASGALSFDNVAVDGSLSAVPEPANVALLVFGVAALGVWTGRRWFRRVNRTVRW